MNYETYLVNCIELLTTYTCGIIQFSTTSLIHYSSSFHPPQKYKVQISFPNPHIIFLYFEAPPPPTWISMPT